MINSYYTLILLVKNKIYRSTDLPFYLANGFCCYSYHAFAIRLTVDPL